VTASTALRVNRTAGSYALHAPPCQASAPRGSYAIECSLTVSFGPLDRRLRLTAQCHRPNSVVLGAPLAAKHLGLAQPTYVEEPDREPFLASVDERLARVRNHAGRLALHRLARLACQLARPYQCLGPRLAVKPTRVPTLSRGELRWAATPWDGEPSLSPVSVRCVELSTGEPSRVIVWSSSFTGRPRDHRSMGTSMFSHLSWVYGPPWARRVCQAGCVDREIEGDLIAAFERRLEHLLPGLGIRLGHERLRAAEARHVDRYLDRLRRHRCASCVH